MAEKGAEAHHEKDHRRRRDYNIDLLMFGEFTRQIHEWSKDEMRDEPPCTKKGFKKGFHEAMPMFMLARTSVMAADS